MLRETWGNQNKIDLHKGVPSNSTRKGEHKKRTFLTQCTEGICELD